MRELPLDTTPTSGAARRCRGWLAGITAQPGCPVGGETPAEVELRDHSSDEGWQGKVEGVFLYVGTFLGEPLRKGHLLCLPIPKEPPGGSWSWAFLSQEGPLPPGLG